MFTKGLVSKSCKVTSIVGSLAQRCPVLREMGSIANAKPVVIAHDIAKDASLSDFVDKCPFAKVLQENGAMALEDASTKMKRNTYDSKFASAIEQIKEEGRFRVFANVERKQGKFPIATKRRSITNSNKLKRNKSPISDTTDPSEVSALQLLTTKDSNSKKEKYQRVQQNEKKDIVVWCSNDYLGMGQNKETLTAMHNALDELGAGSGGTRNISGNTNYHEKLETELASWHNKDRALLFGSCYVANSSTLATLPKILPGVIFLSDEKNHASLIDGMCRNPKMSSKLVFKHNDTNHLRQLLSELDVNAPKVIVFESVYSMDGTIAPIEEICDIADEFNALTFIDEVHAIGLYGNTGAGVLEREGLTDRVDIVSGTLGKAVGVFGGYIAASNSLIEAIRSLAAGFIFTTSLPPAVLAGALTSVKYLKQHNELRAIHRRKTSLLKSKLRERGLPLMESASHIVPLLVGDAHLCKKMSDRLIEKHNVYLQPINYPTVAVGTERFRITPSPVHSDEMINQLVDAFVEVWNYFALPLLPKVNGNQNTKISNATKTKEYYSNLNSKSSNTSAILNSLTFAKHANIVPKEEPLIRMEFCDK